MRVVLQRVSHASVAVEREIVGKIDLGLLAFVGFGPEDTSKEVIQMCDKIAGLRIFEDDDGKMNLSIRDVQGEILIVSQFTLWGDCRKGRRPSFTNAATPDIAEPLYEQFVTEMAMRSVRVATGSFGADMQVTIVNEGPVTMLLESW